LFEPLPGGHRNRVLRGTGKGAAYVFKSTTRTAEALAWLDRARKPAIEAGFVVALPERTLSGAVAAQGWTMERFVHGAPLRETDLPKLRRAIAGLHRRTHGVPQRPGFATARALLSQERGGDVDLTRMPPHLVEMCRAAWAKLPKTPLCLIHGDLSPGNILVLPSGRFALLDWDEARVDLPQFDKLALGETGDTTARCAALAFELATCWCIEPARGHRLARMLVDALEAVDHR
jgi:fructosamine-3-kinase